jgi:hypothetical protein
VLAVTPPDVPNLSGHWPWWIWLWILLLLLAIEGTRRYYLKLRKEQKSRSPWAR